MRRRDGGKRREGKYKYITNGTDFEFWEFNFRGMSFLQNNLFLCCFEIQKVRKNNNFSGVHGSGEIKELKEARQFEKFI